MPIPFSCESCGRSLNVRDELAGRQIYCPECKSILTVPNWSPPPEADPLDVPAEPADELDLRAEQASAAPAEPVAEEAPPRPLPDEKSGPRATAIIVGLVLIAIAVGILVYQIDNGFNNGAAIRIMVFLFIGGIAAFIKGLTGNME